jgi:hypothetical protein
MSLRRFFSIMDSLKQGIFGEAMGQQIHQSIVDAGGRQ